MTISVRGVSGCRSKQVLSLLELIRVGGLGRIREAPDSIKEINEYITISPEYLLAWQ